MKSLRENILDHRPFGFPLYQELLVVVGSHGSIPRKRPALDPLTP